MNDCRGRLRDAQPRACSGLASGVASRRLSTQPLMRITFGVTPVGDELKRLIVIHELLRLRFLPFLFATAMGTWLGGLAAEVKAENKVARIAYVFPDSGGSFPSEAFGQRLRDLGWIEGKNLVLDQYWAAGHLDRFPDLMRQALAQSPDILVTGSTPGALAAKKATTTVPIVVASMGDPAKSGVVTNLAKPGGNLTALSTGYVDGFAGKWLRAFARSGTARYLGCGALEHRQPGGTPLSWGS